MSVVVIRRRCVSIWPNCVPDAHIYDLSANPIRDDERRRPDRVHEPRLWAALVFASNIFGQLNSYQVGWPACREVTDRLVALGWRVILYDVRGMGSSDRDVEDLSLEARVHDLEAVVSHLRLERFALGGVDIGAATAISFAVDNQEKLSALVLLSPWASGARHLKVPRLRAAYSAEPMADDDPQLFARLLTGGSSD